LKRVLKGEQRSLGEVEESQMVSCCLWFPDASGTFDTVYLTSLESEEWTALGEWARARHRELPALAELLSRLLPTKVAPAELPGLFAECERVDWDSLIELALSGFASLSLVVSQAAAQTGAGLRFASENAEKNATAGGPRD
jgi:hypothetical protein